MGKILNILFIQLIIFWGYCVDAQDLKPQKEVIKQAEKYINDIKNLKAEFVQQNPNGSTIRGVIYISRPGKMRIAYAAPSQLKIIANGTWLIQHDPVMSETSHVTLDSTPAGFLLSDNLDINGKMNVVSTKSDNYEMLIVLAPKVDNNFRRLEIRFEQYPLRLDGWKIEDLQGNITTVRLLNITRPTELNPRLFVLEK